MCGCQCFHHVDGLGGSLGLVLYVCRVGECWVECEPQDLGVFDCREYFVVYL